MDWVTTLLPSEGGWDRAIRGTTDDGHEIVATVLGDGSPEAPQLVGMTCAPPLGEDGVRLKVRVPSMSEIGEAVDLLAIEGCVFQLPGIVAGMNAPDESGAATHAALQLVQVGRMSADGAPLIHIPQTGGPQIVRA